VSWLRANTRRLFNFSKRTGQWDTYKEMLTCYNIDSKLIEDSGDGQGQQNLGVCRSITNRGKWNLAKQVINQSNLRWVLSTFRPLKSAGTDEIVWALLQQGAEYLLPHLCCIFRACMGYRFIPVAWRQIRSLSFSSSDDKRN
jgi:hypothetical protein